MVNPHAGPGTSKASTCLTQHTSRGSILALFSCNIRLTMFYLLTVNFLHFIFLTSGPPKKNWSEMQPVVSKTNTKAGADKTLFTWGGRKQRADAVTHTLHNRFV
jgi:hypothetical protein